MLNCRTHETSDSASVGEFSYVIFAEGKNMIEDLNLNEVQVINKIQAIF